MGKVKPTIPDEISVNGRGSFSHRPIDTFAHQLKHSFKDCGVVETFRGGGEWITPKGWRTLIDYPQIFHLNVVKGGEYCRPELIDGVATDEWLKQRRAISEAFEAQVALAEKAWGRVDAATNAMNEACVKASDVAQRIMDEDATTHADLKLQALVASHEGKDLYDVIPQYAAGLIRSLLQFVEAKRGSSV